MKEEEKETIERINKFLSLSPNEMLNFKIDLDSDIQTILNLIETQKAEIEELNRENERQHELLCNIHNKNEQEKVDLRLQYIAEIEKKNKMIDELKKLIEEINETARNWQDSSLKRLQIILDMATEIFLKEPLKYNNKFEVIEYFTKLVEEEK